MTMGDIPSFPRESSFAIDGYPCGNCGEELPATTLHRLVTFVHLDELSEAVKRGTINSSACLFCGFTAWHWPGLLIYAQRSDRAVYVPCKVQGHIEQEPMLRELVEILRLTGTPIPETEKFFERTLWAPDYRAAARWFFVPDEAFKLDALGEHLFRQRARMTSLDDRARALLEHIVQRQAIVIQGDEVSSEFERAFQARVSALAQDELSPIREVVDEVLQFLATSASRASADEEPRDRSSATSQADDSAGPPPVFSQTMYAIFEAYAAPVLQRQCGLDAQGADSSDGLGPIFLAVRAGHSDAEDSSSLRLPSFPVDPDQLAQRQSAYASRLLSDSLSAARTLLADTCSEAVHLTGADLEALQPGHADRERAAQLATVAATMLAQDGIEPEFTGHVASALLAVGFQERWPALMSMVLCLMGRALPLTRDDDTPIALLVVSSYLGLELVETGLQQADDTLYLAVTLQGLARMLRERGWLGAGRLLAGFAARIFKALGRLDGWSRAMLDAATMASDVDAFGAARYAMERILAQLKHQPEVDDQGPGDEAAVQLAQILRGRRDEAAVRLAQILCQQDKREPKLAIVRLNHPRPLDHVPAAVLADGILQHDPELAATRREILTGQPADDFFVVFAVVLRNPTTGTERVVLADICGHQGFALLEELTTSALQARDYERYVFLLSLQFRFFADRRLLSFFGPSHERWGDILQRHDLGDSSRAVAVLSSAYFAEAYLDRARELQAARVSDASEFAFAQAARTTPPDVLKLIQLGIRNLELCITTLENDESSHLRHSLASGAPRTELSLGDLYNLRGTAHEAAGEHEMARRAYLSAQAHFVRRRDAALSESDAEYFQSQLVAIGFRLARATVREFEKVGDSNLARLALEAIEAYKAQAVVEPLRPYATAFDAGHVARARRPPSMSELRKSLPSKCALLVYACLPRTNLIEGFWAVFLVFPDEESIIGPVRFGLGEVQELVDEVRRTRAAAVAALERDSFLSPAHSDLLAACDHALDALSDRLIPPAMRTAISDRDVRHIYFEPEAYLYDVPFPGLRIVVDGSPRYVWDLRRDGSGVGVSVIPNWSFLLRGTDKGAMETSSALLACSRASGLPRLYPLRKWSDELRRELSRLGPVKEYREAAATARAFSESLHNASVCVFLGHGGEVPDVGTHLRLSDASVGGADIVAMLGTGKSLRCRLLFLGACSASRPGHRHDLRDIVGPHVLAVRAGINAVVGAVEPISHWVVGQVARAFLKRLADGESVALAMSLAQRDLVLETEYAHPIFWAQIAVFGIGSMVMTPLSHESEELHS